MSNVSFAPAEAAPLVQGHPVKEHAALPSYRHVLHTFISQSDGKQLISHQIESFNQFIEVDIPEIIHMSNPIMSHGSPEIPLAGPRSALATATGLSTTAANALMGLDATGQTAVAGATAPLRAVRGAVQHEYEVTLEFEKISIRKPTIFENNGAIHPMMPNDARLRNLTYAAPLNVDVKVTTTFIDNTRNGIRETNVRIFPNVHLGKIPIMVGSKYCLLHDQRHVHPSTMGECAEDVGGYFIIQGGERAMISMERMSENRPFVFRNGRPAAKQLEMVEIKCIGPDNDQVPKSNTIKIVFHPKNQLITMLRATIPRIKTDIPVVILFRALGVLSDADIYELILGPMPTTEEKEAATAKATESLKSATAEAPSLEPAFDTLLTESILEASEIHTQEQAFTWLAEHTNTWSVKSQRQTNVQDILAEELFPHIGGKEMNYEKACFLAHMCRKVLWTTTKRIPTDDRDAYPNKRVDIPGFLLADLFRKTYNNRMVKDMKSALSKEIHGGSWRAMGNWSEIVNINNINKIIKSTIMDVCLKSSLATGNFGCGKIGGPNKVGVSQVLNRMNYSAGISHLRRISTPIEKTGKLIAPRKQHNSQYGYICLTRDTKVLLGDGMTSQEIGTMHDGDRVMTADPQTLEESPSAIHHYFRTTPERVLKIKTLSGREVGCSPDHPFLIVRGGENVWVHARDLAVGDQVIVKNYTEPVLAGEDAMAVEYRLHQREGTLSREAFEKIVKYVDDTRLVMPISSICDIPVEDVYDFTTESDNHDFYANGILVRNCPCETPEGHGVGVVKNMAVTTMVTIFSSPITVYLFLQNLGTLISLRDSTTAQKHTYTRVFLNGSWVGILSVEDTPRTVNQLRKAKRSGVIHIYTGIVWKTACKELWISTEAGRVIRPIYFAPALREIARDHTGSLVRQIHSIKEWNNLLLWRTPQGRSLIEFIDAGETDGTFIAMDGTKALADRTTTHCEIHPSVILGTTASYIPFPDHNQSPRNAYQCLWEEEEVLMATGQRKAIKDVRVGERVMSVNPETGKLVSARVVNQYVRETDKTIYRLTTVSGRTLVATDNHPLMTPEGWMTVEEIRQHPAPMIAILPHWHFPLNSWEQHVAIVSQEEMTAFMIKAYDSKWGYNAEAEVSPHVKHHLDLFKSIGLCPLWRDDHRLPVIARVYAIFDSGTNEAEELTKQDAYLLSMSPSTLRIFLSALGMTGRVSEVPAWIRGSMQNVKREFLGGIMGGHGASLSLQKDGAYLSSLDWTYSMANSCNQQLYVEQIAALFREFDVKVNTEWHEPFNITSHKGHASVSIMFDQTPQNMMQFYKVIGYRYNQNCIIEGFKVFECLSGAITMRHMTASRPKILMDRMLVRGDMVFVPVESIIPHERVRIADITVDNHFHSFITTHSIVSHNSSMGKQAMGIYALNFRERFDAMSHVLCYPEIPMVSTYMSRFYGAEKLPAGQNIVVAIMTYTGYNQEDSNMINRAALDRGRFRSIFYRTYKDEERKNQSSGEEERFCHPDPTETKHMKNAHYEKLGDDGFVPKNTFVTPDDILIGKVVPLRVPTGAVLPAGAKKARDVSKMPRNNEKGYVDKIYKNRNGEGYSFVKIRMRQDRIPEIGDKFCLTADHDVLTRGRGWVPIADVTMEDEVAQLNRDTNTMEYVTPLETLVFDQDGDMYEVESQGVSLHVTMNHRMWVQRRDQPAYELIEASKIVGKRVRYQSAAPVNREDLEITIGQETFREERMDAWLAVLGIWLAEGWTSIRPNYSICRVEFAANKPRVLQKLNACCEALNWKYNYVDSSQKFYINHREITHYLSPFSVGAVNKRVPQWAFELSARQTRILIDGMCLGDGHETATSLHYSTSAIGLRDDLQILCQHAGWTSYYAKRYEAGHQTNMKDGRIITTTHDNWDIGIRRTRLCPTMNHGHVNDQNGQTESVHPFTGKVYCLRVPSEVFLVRRHARIVWTGNSSRHGQKGTMGMILNQEDMPQTASGIVPDIIINPHCIPSRMTVAQLMETLLSKVGCMTGALGDGSPFGETTVEDLASILRDQYGMEPYGNEVMYNGYTGRMMETSIFIGPCYYQRLRHCSADKMHSRASGPLVMLTRQPAEGRAREGGLRFGEMERDCVIAHGMAEFTKERLMECSDSFSCYSCRGCGLIAVAHPEQNIWSCRGCGNTTNFAHIHVPYATKLLLQELETMNIASRLITQQKLLKGTQAEVKA
jgi:DNA-directed RNA polymerase beta subunit